MVAIYCYLECENHEGCKFHSNNSSYFEISTSLECHPPIKFEIE